MGIKAMSNLDTIEKAYISLDFGLQSTESTVKKPLVDYLKNSE